MQIYQITIRKARRQTVTADGKCTRIDNPNEIAITTRRQQTVARKGCVSWRFGRPKMRAFPQAKTMQRKRKARVKTEFQLIVFVWQAYLRICLMIAMKRCFCLVFFRRHRHWRCTSVEISVRPKSRSSEQWKNHSLLYFFVVNAQLLFLRCVLASL